MSRVSRRFLLAATILAMPIAAYAQEAVFTGTVTDSTGGVLPGVTVTALLEATGNTFVAVTDERGVYRLPARVGVYRDHRGTAGLHDRRAAGHPAARRPDARREPRRWRRPRLKKRSPSTRRRRC